MSARSRRSEGSLLRGTLIAFRRRCGKPTCHCASGEPHESPALAYTEGGRTKTLTLADADVAEAINPQVRGWFGFYGAFYRSELGILAKRHRRASRRMGDAQVQTATRQARPGVGLVERCSAA